jgi:uncharacterized membrane protein (UPF0127 family)
MRWARHVAVSLLVLAVVTSGCVTDREGTGIDAPEPYTDATVAFVVDGEQTGELAVEIAETRRERARGLMERESVPDGAGMLFVYEDAAPRAFWMKNTLVPLDIIFVNEEMRVLNVEHASPEPYTPEDELTRYHSDGPARYVVEAERGYANETGVSSGDELIIRR